MPKTTPKIRLNLNLLYPQGIPEQLPIRFLKWLLNYGRFIVVFVEMVVLTTFGYRFVLDARLADLKEEINTQIPFIESLQPTESIIKQTQFKLDTIKRIHTSIPDPSKIVAKIASQTPQTINFSTLNLNTSNNTLQFKINGQSRSNTGVTTFLNSLKSETSFKDITLASISFSQGTFTFTITGTAL